MIRRMLGRLCLLIALHKILVSFGRRWPHHSERNTRCFLLLLQEPGSDRPSLVGGLIREGDVVCVVGLGRVLVFRHCCVTQTQRRG